jgi:hypothetical protein
MAEDGRLLVRGPIKTGLSSAAGWVDGMDGKLLGETGLLDVCG